MAIINEEEDDQQQLKPQPTKPHQKPPNPSTAPNNPFSFWLYFTLTVSLITAMFVSFEFLSPRDPKSWFLGLPSGLRQHYTNGRTIKVQTHPDQSPIEVFTFEQGRLSSENVVFVHGLGLSSYSFRSVLGSLGAKGVRVVAVDLPGHGFSDKSVMEIGRSDGVFGRFWDVYSEIQEKGLFWAFDRIIETGQMPYEEIEARVSTRKISKAIELGPEEIGKVLGQVIETLGLSPMHLVLHDSALGMIANWVSENSNALRSVTLIDTSPRSLPALPLWVLEVPVAKELVLGLGFVYSWLVEKCCSRGIDAGDLEAHRVLLKGMDARRAVVGMGKKLNYSFDAAEWGGSAELKGLPVQVLWSKSWTKEWSEEGDRVAEALRQASFVKHSGGRWPQEDSADEIAQNIFRFVSSLPATVRIIKEEPIPEHIQRMLDEAKTNGGHHDHHHGHGGHGPAHEAGFMDAYGLGQGHGYGL